MTRNRYFPLVCFFLALAVLCTCAAVMIAGGVEFFRSRLPATPTAQVMRPQGISTETIMNLQNTILPINDPLDLVQRLRGQPELSPVVDPPATPFQVGDREVFWITDQDTQENSQVDAVLQEVSDHVYFWVQEGLEFDAGDLRTLVQTFETEIYPTNRQFFGSEWSPGVDGDVHLYMLYTQGLGSSIAGIFSTADEYPTEAHPYSNAHEMFMLSADNMDIDDSLTYGVLAHEFQHMIHWNLDLNESTWLNEGFSELAAFLNGYHDDGFAMRYVRDPDIQLTDWPDSNRATLAHYGGSFLFVVYFLDRFGSQATQTLAAHPANGMESLDAVLGTIQAVDPLTGNTLQAEDVFSDWVLASYLNDPSISDGRYAYIHYADAPTPKATEKVTHCPTDAVTRFINQFGVDYIRITCKGSYTLNFEGSTQVKVVPAEVHSGRHAFWSNNGDMTDTHLTRLFNFTNHSGPLTLSYWTWFELEDGYDYTYLEASTDGESWTILPTPACTNEDSSGNSYGCGYNGASGQGSQPQWIEQQVDLSQYAGQKVWLRFETVTDAAVHLDGLLLDDVAIPEIGYASNFEVDSGGWEAAGFVRIENVLPQTFRLAVIYKGKQTRVEYIPLGADVTADIPLSIGEEVDEVILVVSGTTRFTRQQGTYQYEIR